MQRSTSGLTNLRHISWCISKPGLKCEVVLQAWKDQMLQSIVKLASAPGSCSIYHQINLPSTLNYLYILLLLFWILIVQNNDVLISIFGIKNLLLWAQGRALRALGCISLEPPSGQFCPNTIYYRSGAQGSTVPNACCCHKYQGHHGYSACDQLYFPKIIIFKHMYFASLWLPALHIPSSPLFRFLMQLTDPTYPIPNITNLTPCADGAGKVIALGSESVWERGTE